MKGFDDVTLGWKGEKYTVPADRQLMLIAEIEDALRGNTGRTALDVLLQAGGPSQARLSQAYGAALRYAGAKVSDDEVYLSIQEDVANRKSDALMMVQSAILALLSIISPPVSLALAPGAEDRADSKKKPKKTARG